MYRSDFFLPRKELVNGKIENLENLKLKILEFDFCVRSDTA